MLTLPIPMFIALVLAFLVAQAVLSGKTSPYLATLLLACAAQSAIVALVQHYGITALRFVQPVTASLIPPLAWIAFQYSAIRRDRLAQDLPHLLGPAFLTFCVIFVPAAIDPALIAMFVIYGGRILLALRGRSDDLPFMRLESGPIPVLIWRVIAIALLASALSDILIAAALATGRIWLQPWILSVFSSLALLIVGLLSLSPDIVGVVEGTDVIGTPPEDVETFKQVVEIFHRLERLLRSEQLYLDPDLTLARLARRTGIPAKQLSAAVNRRTGANASRYINGFRIDHACAQLRAGANVTEAMLASGFNTKSNFNREFLRITGQTPSQWRQGHDAKERSNEHPAE